MPLKLIDLPDETLLRLYRVAYWRHQSPDRVIRDLIDDAASQEAVTRAMNRFYARVGTVQAETESPHGR